MPKKSILLFVISSILLSSCNTSSNDSPGINRDDTGTLSVDLISSLRGFAIPNSHISIFKSGTKDIVATGITNTNGYASFDLPIGSYDIIFKKEDYAVSALYGAIVRENHKNNRYKIAQFKAENKYEEPVIPKLIIETPNEINQDGTVKTWQKLTGNMKFSDTIKLRAYTNPELKDPLVMQNMLFSLVTFNDKGEMIEKQLANSQINPSIIKTGLDQTSGLIELPIAELSGQAYIQVSALDFNNDRSAYLIPIQIDSSISSGEVQAPSKVYAVAYTLSQPINFVYSIKPSIIARESWKNIKPQASAPNTNLWVDVAWEMPSLKGVKYFRILRSTQADEGYQQIDFVPATSDFCLPLSAETNYCLAQDNTATLEPDQDYYYRVEVVGKNTAISSIPQQPSTHTLLPFEPELLQPAAEADKVDWLPEYTFKANLNAIGAHRAQFNLVVTDLFTASKIQDFPPLVMEDNGNSVTIHSLSDENIVYYNKNNKNNLINYSRATDIISIPHGLKEIHEGKKPQPLLANHRYAWMLDAAYAYRVMNPLKSVSPENPITAYSIYSDAGDMFTKLVPGAPAQYATDIHYFITKSSGND